MKISLGCGFWTEPGWTGLDNDPAAVKHALAAGHQVVRGDVRLLLPWADGSAEYVHHEHLIEHLSRNEAVRLMAECFRVLRPGGVLRVATPSLEEHCRLYLAGQWQLDGIDRYNADLADPQPDDGPPGTFKITGGCEVLNSLFYWWGHRWIYDAQYLSRRFRQAGFESILQCARGAARHLALCGMERRPGSVIVEGTKP